MSEAHVIASSRGRLALDIASIVLIAIVFAWLTQRGWGRWADAIYNTGRELHIAEQLAEGRSLYRDIAHLNGPLSQQINAQLFRTFGPRVSVLTIANLVSLGALLAMIWWLWRRLADEIAASAACIVLLVLFALSPGSRAFNYALPYEHEATHGLIFAIGAMCAFAKYLSTRQGRWLWVVGCLLGLVLLTKFGIFVAALVPVLVGLTATMYGHRVARREAIRNFAAVISPIIVIAFVAYSLLSNDLSVSQKLSAIFGSARFTAHQDLLEMPWYREWLGIRATGRSFDDMVVCALAYIALLAPPFAAGVLARRAGEWRIAASVAAPLVVLAVLFTFYQAISWSYAFRGLTLVTIALAIALGVSLLHRARRDIDHVLILRLTVVWFALFMILHLGLRAVIVDYGVVFAMPATLVAVAAGVSWIPAIAQRGGGTGWPSRAAMLVVLGVLVVVYIQRDNRRLAQPSFAIGDGADALIFDSTGKAMIEMSRELRARTRAGETLLVAPDGVMLNHLSGLPNPTPYFNLMPPDIAMFGGQARVRDAIARNPPDWFVLTSGEVESFGFKSFATDYGAEIWRWIEPRYERVATVGDARFAMILFKRRAVE